MKSDQSGVVVGREQPPPGSARTSSVRGNDFPGIEELKVLARDVLSNADVTWGPNKINRVCARYVDRVQGTGFSFFDYMTNQLELAGDQNQRTPHRSLRKGRRVRRLADPTGEYAAYDVDHPHQIPSHLIRSITTHTKF